MEHRQVTSSGMFVPKQQKQRLVESEMPSDPAERKRVLNVLAQRRYRQRKKEQQAQLEGFIKAIGPINDSHYPSTQSSRLSNATFSSQSSSDAHASPDSNVQESSNDPADIISASTETGIAMPIQDSPFPTQPSNTDSLETAFSSFIHFPSEDIRSDNSPSTSSTEEGVRLTNEWPSISSSDLALQFSSFLQNDEVENTTFADDHLVAVPELDLLRAAHSISLRLHSADRLWDPDANSIFLSDIAFDWSQLPENLQPTSSQLSIPHHPVLDLLPWPKVRTKLITMYSMPSGMWPRHPSDKTEMTPFRLVCDMEDGGIRVLGEDPTEESAWEVQQNFVNAWWWCLDQNVIYSANQKKRARGEEVLSLGSLGG